MNRTVSLKKNSDFQFVYQNGKSFGNRYLVLYVLRRDGKSGQNEESADRISSINRLGISVSKKVGNSVVRHRLTRLIRESYRLNEEKFVGGLDLIVIARPGAKERNFFDIESALLHVSRKQKIIRESNELC